MPCCPRRSVSRPAVRSPPTRTTPAGSGSSSPGEPRSDEVGERPAGDASGEEAPAEERALERPVAVHAPAAEARRLARGVEAAERLAALGEHTAPQIAFETAERLARQDVQ